MKRNICLLFFVVFSILGFSQVSPIIDCEFSQGLDNTGDSAKYILETIANEYVSDRKGVSGCALKLEKQPIRIINIDSSIFSARNTYAFSMWIKIKEVGESQFYLISTSNYYHSISLNQTCVSGYNYPIGGCRTFSDLTYYSGIETDWHHLVLSNEKDSVYLYVDNKLHSKAHRTISEVENSLLLFDRFTGVVDNFKFFKNSLNKEAVNSLFLEPSNCEIISSNNDYLIKDNLSIFYKNGILYTNSSELKRVVVFNLDGVIIFDRYTDFDSLKLDVTSGLNVVKIISLSKTEMIKIMEY